MIYARNNFALRKRTGGQELNNLNLPFMNFKQNGIESTTKRNWFNYVANTNGIYVSELNRKLRLSPITINYDATAWFGRDDDTQYAAQLLTYDNDVETRITFNVEILGVEVQLLAILDYKLRTDLDYDEAEWLTKNNIHSIGIDFIAQTFYVKDNLDICIPKSVVWDFQAQNQLGDIGYEKISTILVNKYTEENTEV